jgi:[acyl-carrier-protein] S-malonyltransferase
MYALTFPGQGAQDPKMLDGVEHLGAFADRHRYIYERTGIDLLRALRSGETDILRRNSSSSLLTVLVGTLSLDAFNAAHTDTPACYAGYSVGQWSAMYAAGMLTFETLVDILVERARLMDECTATSPRAMCAVIGLPQEAIERELSALREAGFSIYLANLNCLGQYSIAGTTSAIAAAEERIAALKPKKLVRLQVEGAWHCPLLAEAETRFAATLEGVSFDASRVPVIDNVTGDWLPREATALRRQLARHLSHAVLWERGVKTMLAVGCKRFVEIGYGNVLTKFGFFIDRKAVFESFYV